MKTKKEIIKKLEEVENAMRINAALFSKEEGRINMREANMLRWVLNMKVWKRKGKDAILVREEK